MGDSFQSVLGMMGLGFEMRSHFSVLNCTVPKDQIFSVRG